MFTLTLRPLTGNWRVSPDQRLRAVLKCLKRGYGFECVMIREDSEARAVQGTRNESVSPGVRTAEAESKYVLANPGARDHGEHRL